MLSTRYSCQILTKLESSRQISEKILKYVIFMKTRPVGAELFHAGGRADGRHDEAIRSIFRSFAN